MAGSLPLPFYSGMDPNTIETMSMYFVSIMGLGFLTINTVAATVWPFDDLLAVSSIFYTFSFVILMFVYLAVFYRLAENPDARDRLKAVIWVLATALGITSASRASMILSLSMAWWIWALAGSISFSSFYFFFIKSDQINGRYSSNVEEV